MNDASWTAVRYGLYSQWIPAVHLQALMIEFGNSMYWKYGYIDVGDEMCWWQL